MTKVCSVLVLLLSTTAAVGQQPGKGEKPKTQQKAPPNELDAAIAASANHPDVRLALAKLQMAQAELEQAKLLVTQRIAAAYAKLKAAKEQVEIEEKIYQQLSQFKSAARSELLQLERSLAQAKAALAVAEAEWQAARGQPAGHAAATKAATASTLLMHGYLAEQSSVYDSVLASLYAAKRANHPPAPGSVADKLRGLIDKRVKLDLKEPVPFDQAMEEFIKQAGLTDLIVRYPEWASARRLKDPPKVGPLVGEQTVTGWLQLILDDFNRSLATLDLVGGFSHFKGKYEAYVRDYGLLITKTDLAPPGAPTLAEFARQVQAQKDATPKAEPKK